MYPRPGIDRLGVFSQLHVKAVPGIVISHSTNWLSFQQKLTGPDINSA